MVRVSLKAPYQGKGIATGRQLAIGLLGGRPEALLHMVQSGFVEQRELAGAEHRRSLGDAGCRHLERHDRSSFLVIQQCRGRVLRGPTEASAKYRRGDDSPIVGGCSANRGRGSSARDRRAARYFRSVHRRPQSAASSGRRFARVDGSALIDDFRVRPDIGHERCPFQAAKPALQDARWMEWLERIRRFWAISWNERQIFLH